MVTRLLITHEYTYLNTLLKPHISSIRKCKKFLSLSVRLYLLNFSTNYNPIFSNRYNYSIGRYICVIHAYFSRKNPKILNTSVRSRAGSRVTDKHEMITQRNTYLLYSGQ